MSGISLGDLIKLFDRACPILPGSFGDSEQALRQFCAEEIGLIQIVRSPLPEWAQGDILDPLLFIEWNEEGDPMSYNAPGMIMSSTCDLDRKKNIVICPCFKLSDLQELSAYQDIPKNTVFDFLFLGSCLTGDEWVVDLSNPITLPRERIEKQIEEGRIYRKHSLTDKGWYLFITKFALKYLRPDDLETLQQR
jgi:hypothetical protein